MEKRLHIISTLPSLFITLLQKIKIVKNYCVPFLWLIFFHSAICTIFHGQKSVPTEWAEEEIIPWGMKRKVNIQQVIIYKWSGLENILKCEFRVLSLMFINPNQLTKKFTKILITPAYFFFEKNLRLFTKLKNLNKFAKWEIYWFFRVFSQNLTKINKM